MKRSLLLFVLSLFVFLTYSCDEDTQDPNQSDEFLNIQARLIDQQGLGVPNAIINVVKIEESDSKSKNVKVQEEKLVAADTTDEDGYFEVTEIPNDLENLNVRILNTDFKDQLFDLSDFKPEDLGNTWSVQVPRNEDCNSTIFVKVVNGGNTLDSSSRESVRGALIRLYREDELNRKSETDENGSFEFIEVCAGNYELEVSADGFESSEAEIEIESESQNEILIVLKPNNDDPACCDASLQLNVTGPNNISIANAIVQIQGDNEFEFEGRTDENGVLEVLEVCEGKQIVTIKAESYKEAELELNFECEEEKVERVELVAEEETECCDNVINVEPIDANGNVIASGVAYIGKGSNVMDSIPIQGQMVSFLDICEGEWRVKVEGPGYYPRDKEFVLECGDTLTWTPEMRADDENNDKDSCCDGSLKINITDEDGNKTGDGELKLYEGDDIIEETELENGEAKLDSLCEGEYVVVVEIENGEDLEFEVKIECDEETEITKVIEEECCDNEVEIRVVDQNGDPVEDAAVIFYRDGRPVADPRTDSDGIVSFKELCEGEYDIKVRIDNDIVEEYELKVECDDEVQRHQIPIKVEEECCDNIVKFIIKDQDGNSPDSARVVIYEGDKAIYEGWAERGIFVQDKLCEGDNYWIKITIGEQVFEKEFIVECDDNEQEIELRVELEDEECCDNRIEIKVIDENGDPVEGAAVVLYKDGKAIDDPRTNSNGAVNIDELCEGNYLVKIRIDGEVVSEHEIKVECSDDEQKHEIQLNKECCDGVLRIKVKDENGESIKGAKLTLWKDRDKVETLETDGDGVVFDGLCEGKYGVDIEHDDYDNIEFEVEIGCDEDKTIEKELSSEECCDNKIEVKVLDENGDPIENAVVILYEDGKAIADPRTNSNGAVNIDELCEGDYLVKIRVDNEIVAEHEIKVECSNDEQKFEYKIDNDCCDGIYRLKVKDENGNAIKGAKVTLWKGRDKVETLETDSNGVVFDGLCEGDYAVDIQHDDYKDIEYELSIDCDEDKSEEKELESDNCCDAVIKAIVKDDASGDKLENIEVELWQDGQMIKSGETNADGEIKFEDLCKDDYVIVITDSNYIDQEHEWKIDDCKEHQETFRLKK